MNAFIESLNLWGSRFVAFAGPMLFQSSVLILFLFAIDYALRRRVRAAIRYALWFVVLLKLALPPSLASPTSVAWWLRPSEPPTPPPARLVVSYAPATIPLVRAPFRPPLPPPVRLSSSAWLLLTSASMSLALFGWMISRWVQVARIVRSGTSLPDNYQILLDRVRADAGFRKAFDVRTTEEAMSPAVCGLFSPTILLPRTLVTRLTSDQLRTVLLHELIHLKRGDVWTNCVQSLFQIFYWWHPLLWLANARIRRVREEAVDDAVVLALNDDATCYAPTLIEVAKLAFRRPLASLGLVGILESRSALRQRIERLVNFTTPGRAGLSVVSFLCIAAFTALAVPMGEAPPKPPIVLVAAQTSHATAAGIAENPNTTQLEVISESSLLDVATGIQTASNHVVIKLGSVTITADTAEINRKTGMIVASGHVQLQRGATRETADTIQFNFKTGEIESLKSSETEPASSPSATHDSSVPTTPERRAILEKLKTIRLEKLSFQSKPLVEVLRQLSQEIKRLDPQKRGINLILNPDSNPGPFHATAIDPATGLPISSAPLASAIDPATGLPVAPYPPATDLKTITVTIDPPLSDIRLIDALDAIAEVAPQIKYSIVDYGIVFTERAPGPELHTRKYKTDPKKFLARLGLTEPFAAEDFHQALLKFFDGIGVNLRPETGRSIFWSDSRGDLLVCATTSELDAVEKWLASPDDTSKSVIDASRRKTGTLIQDGKILFELGKLDEAEAKLKQALVTDAENKAAPYYLKLIKETRERNSHPKSGTNSPVGSPQTASSERHTRLFKVDPNAFIANLQEAGALNLSSLASAPSTERTSRMRDLVQTALISWFTNVGVDLSSASGKSVLWNDYGGTLLVRATEQDLDAIESVVQQLNIAPPQVNIRTKFIEVSGEAARALQTKWASANTSSTGAWNVVLAPAQARDLLQDLERRNDANLINQGEVTTLHGRQAQIQVTDMHTLVTGINPQALIPPGVDLREGTNGLFQTRSVPFGPTLDVVPYVETNGHTIELTITPTVTEFLGYKKSSEALSVYVQGKEEKISSPLPHFRVRQTNVQTSLEDGNSVLFGGFIQQEVVSGNNTQPQIKTVQEDSKRNLLVLVTTTLIDPAGNRIHPEKK